MKLVFVIPVLLAMIPTPPPGNPPLPIDVNGKENFELVGVGAAKIQIRSQKESETLVTSYLATGTVVFTHFSGGRLNGMFIQRQFGEVKTVLFDNDGDGLPEVRHTFDVRADGEQRLTKIERLQWTGNETK